MLSDFHKEILLAALRSNLDTEFWIHDEIERKYNLDQSHPDYKMVYEFLESSALEMLEGHYALQIGRSLPSSEEYPETNSAEYWKLLFHEAVRQNVLVFTKRNQNQNQNQSQSQGRKPVSRNDKILLIGRFELIKVHYQCSYAEAARILAKSQVITVAISHHAVVKKSGLELRKANALKSLRSKYYKEEINACRRYLAEYGQNVSEYKREEAVLPIATNWAQFVDGSDPDYLQN